MSDIFISVISFIVAVSIIVTVHEFGHFIVARLLNVRVLRFSIGFGQSLIRYVSPRSGVEYVVAAIPLGGYVKMLDEREGDVDPEERDLAFNQKSVFSRIAIVAAGPAFNFIFAIAAYFIMYLVGVQGMKPEIGQIEDNSIAYEAGLMPGDEFMQINEQHVVTWEDTNIYMIDEALKTGMIEVRKRNRNGEVSSTMLDLSDTKELLDEGNLLDKIGITPWRVTLAPRMGVITEGGAAERDGMKTGDLILTANGVPVGDWGQWVDIVRAHPEQVIDLLIQREGAELRLQIVPDQVADGRDPVGRIGAGPWAAQDEVEKRRIGEEIKQQQVVVKHGFGESFVKGVVKTLDMSVLTVKLLGKLVVGEASLKNISGPISIAEYAGISAQLGLATFLSTLAIISISIGILNLLPIPILDGGHLMYYLVEIVKGSPVSEAAQMHAQKIGIFMLAGLMTLAFYNDFQRLFG